jgi:hypothetical protein
MEIYNRESIKLKIRHSGTNCVKWYKNSTRKLYSDSLRKQFKNNCMVVSKLPSLKDKVHLPGGTMTLTINDMVDRV